MASLLQSERVLYLVQGEKKVRAPLSQLYFCRYCSELRSLECVSHEVTPSSQGEDGEGGGGGGEAFILVTAAGGEVPPVGGGYHFPTLLIGLFSVTQICPSFNLLIGCHSERRGGLGWG